MKKNLFFIFALLHFFVLYQLHGAIEFLKLDKISKSHHRYNIAAQQYNQQHKYIIITIQNQTLIQLLKFISEQKQKKEVILLSEDKTSIIVEIKKSFLIKTLLPSFEDEMNGKPLEEQKKLFAAFCALIKQIKTKITIDPTNKLYQQYLHHRRKKKSPRKNPIFPFSSEQNTEEENTDN